MSDVDQFTAVFNTYVARSAHTPGQLASLTSVPKMTIVNWLNGRVHRPRSWHGLVEVAAALRLTEAEADHLLTAAQQPTLQTLRRQPAPASVQQALTFWQTAVPLPIEPPFQAISLLPYFVGREAEREIVTHALTQEPQTAVVCLHGMAGVGKTSLAARLAYDLRHHFADGVLWARLDSSDAMSILAAFAAAYQRDVSNCLDIASRSGVVRDLLSARQTLIVLDNAQTSAQIEPLLPPTGRCAVLVTTRRQDLAILAGARRVALRPFAPDAATSLALFAQILEPARVQAERELLTQIADELGHLPLALAIAASRLAYEPGWQTAQFGERLRRVSQRLQALRYETQNVRRSFQLSYEWLDETGRQLLATAGVLGRQDFAADMVAALAELEEETAVDGLRQLFTLSLVQGGANGRYTLHPLLHDFAQELPHPDDMAERLVSYWAAFLAAQRYRSGAVAQEMGHIQVALATAVTRGWLRPLRQMMDALMPTLLTQGAHTLAEQYLRQAQAMIAATQDAVGRCWLLLRWGQLARERHQLSEAAAQLQAGLLLARQQQEPHLESHLLTELGVVQNCLGNFAQGKTFLLEALPLARQTAATDSLLTVLEELGILALQAGDDETAARYYQEGLSLAQAEQNEAQSVMFFKSLGAWFHLQGAHTEARQLFAEGFALAQRLGFHKGLMLLGNNLGVAAFAAGQPAEAGRYLQAALAEAERLRDEQAQALIGQNLTHCQQQAGHVKLFI
ncbi:MAG TPA: NB-ARC domain-containing protein [Chloroflexota bacterium]|nr:NB-ARC domain-containing protein [Chloroflexota bacterium]